MGGAWLVLVRLYAWWGGEVEFSRADNYPDYITKSVRSPCAASDWLADLTADRRHHPAEEGILFHVRPRSSCNSNHINSPPRAKPTTGAITIPPRIAGLVDDAPEPVNVGSDVVTVELAPVELLAVALAVVLAATSVVLVHVDDDGVTEASTND